MGFIIGSVEKHEGQSGGCPFAFLGCKLQCRLIRAGAGAYVVWWRHLVHGVFLSNRRQIKGRPLDSSRGYSFRVVPSCLPHIKRGEQWRGAYQQTSTNQPPGLNVVMRSWSRSIGPANDVDIGQRSYITRSILTTRTSTTPRSLWDGTTFRRYVSLATTPRMDAAQVFQMDLRLMPTAI